VTKQQVVEHFLVGYNPISERPVYFLEIPQSKARLLKGVVSFDADDPQGYDSYKLNYSQASHLVALLGVQKLLPNKLEYFIESSTASPTKEEVLPTLAGLISSSAPGDNVGKPLMLALLALLASGALFRGAGTNLNATAGPQPTSDEGVGGLLRGLGGLLDRLQRGGLGDVANAWVHSGQKQSVSPNQLGPALGPDIIKALTERSGLSEEELTKQLSQILPGVVDKLTPNSRLPTLSELFQIAHHNQ
jgi:uncharacterized protein YidB (DUF937 family)